MENFDYALLKAAPFYPVNLALVETDGEVRICPARFPFPRWALTCGAGIAGMWGVAAVAGHMGMRDPDKMVIFAGVYAAVGLVAVSSQYRREAERGPVLLVDRRKGRYLFPRTGMEGVLADLTEIALVEGRRDIGVPRVYELQLLARRGDAAPAAIPLTGGRGAKPLAEIQEKLAAALGLPAVKVRAAA